MVTGCRDVAPKGGMVRDLSLDAGAETFGTMDRDWAAVLASAFGLIFSVGTLSVYTFGVFVHPLSKEFGWNRTQLSSTLAISQYVLAFSSPFWGAWADRFGPRATLIPSITALGLLVASLGLLTPHLWHLYLVFAAMPLLAGGATPLGYSSVLIRLFERHLGLSLGLAIMGVGIGAFLLPPMTQQLVGLTGWRDTYVVLGALTLVIGLPAAFVATRNASGPVLRLPGAMVSAVAPLLRTRVFLLMCVIFFLLGTISVGTLAHLVPMMVDRGFSPGAAARVAAVTGIATLLGRGGIGWVLDKASAAYVLAAVSLFAAVAFLLLGYSGAQAASYLAAFLLGGVIGAEVDFIAFLTRRHFAAAVFGRLYGLGFGIYMIGAGTGPLLMGKSFDSFGGYRPALTLFAVLGVVAAAVALALPSHPRERPA